MSEKVNINRKQGDPIVFNIDLKWSLWTQTWDTWQEKAPVTYRHLVDGFNGAFDEFGDTIVIHTAPAKEIRFGTVTIEPKKQLVTVSFHEEFDEGEDPPAIYEDDSFPLPESMKEFLEQVDAAEARLIEKVKEL